MNDLDGLLEFGLVFQTGLYYANSIAASLCAPINLLQILACPSDPSDVALGMPYYSLTLYGRPLELIPSMRMPT